MNEKKFRIKMKEVKGSAGSNLPPRSPSDRQKKLTGDHEDREDRVSSTKTCRYPAPANYQNLSPRLNLSFPWIEKMKVQKHHYPPPPPSSSSSSFLLLFFFFSSSSSFLLLHLLCLCLLLLPLLPLLLLLLLGHLHLTLNSCFDFILNQIIYKWDPATQMIIDNVKKQNHSNRIYGLNKKKNSRFKRTKQPNWYQKLVLSRDPPSHGWNRIKSKPTKSFQTNQCEEHHSGCC